VKQLYPIAGAQGTNVAITAGTTFAPWPPQFWIDSPGITFTPTPITGVFNAEIAPDAVPGPHFVRLFNEDGSSDLRFFVVTQQPDLREVEPNDNFRSPQHLANLPNTVNGRLDKGGDVDSFAVTLKRGQTLVAWLEGYVLSSTFDGMLRIVDSTGIQQAFNHDGRTLDPFVAWEAPQDGTFLVQVMGFAHPAGSSVQFTGGEACVYRLHLTSGPFVRHTIPLAAQRGKKTPVQLLGWNLATQTAELDYTDRASLVSLPALPFPGTISEQALAITDFPETLENEPTDPASVPQMLNLPGAVTGRIDKANDEDRFTFSAVKQRIYELQITAAKAGSPLDAWLKIENKDGKELSRNDDAGSRDPNLTWTAPDDGVFTVAVGDVTQRGGADFIYRLALTEAAPSVAGTAEKHAFTIKPGESSEIKVTVKPANGFKQKMQLLASDLPEGVTAAGVEVPEKGGDVTLKLTAEAGAKPAGRPVRLVLREAEGGKEHAVRHFLTTTSENNGVPQGYTDLLIDSTDQLWLTVLAAPAK
jgi:hypothetical protein